MADCRSQPAELEADIARQREELADTVNELTEQVQVRRRPPRSRPPSRRARAVVAVVVIVVKRRRS